jgi:hypothetical protein
MDGTHDACYLVLTAIDNRWQPTFRRVSYDFARVEAAFKQHHLYEILGLEGLLKCEQVRRARPTVASFSRWMQRHYPGDEATLSHAREYLKLPLAHIWETLNEGYHVNFDIPLPDFQL